MTSHASAAKRTNTRIDCSNYLQGRFSLCVIRTTSQFDLTIRLLFNLSRPLNLEIPIPASTCTTHVPCRGGIAFRFPGSSQTRHSPHQYARAFRHVNLANSFDCRETHIDHPCADRPRVCSARKRKTKLRNRKSLTLRPGIQPGRALPRNPKTSPRFSPHIGNGAVRVYRLRATRPLTRQSSGNWISLPCLPCPESLDALTRPFREAHLLPVSYPRRPRCTTSPQNSTLHYWGRERVLHQFLVRRG